MNEPSQGFQPPPTDEQIAENEVCQWRARQWRAATLKDQMHALGYPTMEEALELQRKATSAKRPSGF